MEVKHHTHAHYRPEKIIFVIDIPLIVKIILDIVNPGSKLITRQTKDKLRIVDITSFEGDFREMLNEIEEMRGNILAEDEIYKDFYIDLLNSLRTVADKYFIFAAN